MSNNLPDSPHYQIHIFDFVKGKFKESADNIKADCQKTLDLEKDPNNGTITAKECYFFTLSVDQNKKAKQYFSPQEMAKYFFRKTNEAQNTGFFDQYVIKGKDHNKASFDTYKDIKLNDGFDVVKRDNKNKLTRHSYGSLNKTYLEVDFAKGNLNGKYITIGAYFKRTDGKGYTAAEVYVCLDVK